MTFYGYSICNDQLLEIREITIKASSSELRKLSAFFIKCASEIENSVGWEHEHFSDFGDDVDNHLDLIIYNSDGEND